MAGKNDSTQHTAPVAVEETIGGKPQQSQQPSSEAKRSPARSEDLPDHHSIPEQQSTMHTQRPSHDLKPPRGMLDRTLQAQLGRQLRAIYSDIASEPVPERFVRLLEALEAKEKRR